MVKLVDIFNTKYFHAVFGPRIAKYIVEHPDATIDLAGAKLTADCASVVNTAIARGTAKFIDTEDSERNHILIHDQELVALRNTLPAPTPLPIPRSMEHAADLLKSDYTDKYLRFSATKPGDFLWLIIFIAKRPDVSIEMPTNTSRTLFRIINTYYDRRSYVGKPVYYVRNNDIGVDVNDKPSLDFCNSHFCVPAVFGQKNLFKEPDWKEPLTAICGDFSSSMGHYGRTIKDVLKGV